MSQLNLEQPVVFTRPDIRLAAAAAFAWALAAWFLGHSVALQFALASACVVAAVLGVARLIFLRKSRRTARTWLIHPVWGTLILCLTAAGLVLGAVGLAQQRRLLGPLAQLAGAGAAVRVEGRIISDPQVVTRTLGPPGLMFRLATQRVQGRGIEAPAAAQLLVFADPQTQLQRGVKVSVSGLLRSGDPGSEVLAVLTAHSQIAIEDSGSGISQVTERIREDFRGVTSSLPEDAAGLLPGLTLGDTSQQSEQLIEDLRATGLTHLSAVSGTNTTLICVLLFFIFRSIGCGRILRILLTVLGLWFYVLLARPDPSVLRAAVMGLVSLTALLGSRTKHPVPILAASVIGLLVYDPWLARSYGFSLSVLATAGLLFIAPRWIVGLSRFFPRWLATALAIPLSAQVLCTPVLLLMAPRISLVSIPANILAAPLVAPATILGLLTALLATISQRLGSMSAMLAGWPCQIIGWIGHQFAAISGGNLSFLTGVSPPWRAVIYCVAVLGFFLLFQSHKKWRTPWLNLVLRGSIASLITLVIPLQFILQNSLSGRILGRPGAIWPPAGWVFVMCDVGQGDALAVNLGQGRAMLIDVGPDPVLVDHCLDRLGIYELPVIVLTHFHADHVQGLAGAIGSRKVGEVITTIVDEPNDQAQMVRTLLARNQITVRPALAGATGVMAGLSWRVLTPHRVIHDGSIPNNASVVLLLNISGVSILALGDVEPAGAAAVLRALTASGLDPKVNVLKVAHHGSGLQDPALINALKPRLALISVGRDNPYGHPSRRTLDLFTKLGTQIARTDILGDLAVISGPKGIELATRATPSVAAYPRPRPP